MLSTRFILLAVLFSAALANPLGANVHRRQSDPPEGFTAAGFAPADEAITIRIALAHRDLPGLEKALYAAATPGGAKYGQYLTKAQISEYASPSEEAIASVSSWLGSHGLTSSSLSPSGDWISVNATVGQANRLLQAEYTRYEAEGIDSPVVRTPSYDLPASVKDYITAVHPTTAFPSLMDERSKHAPRNITSAGNPGRQASTDLVPEAETSGVPLSCIPEGPPGTGPGSLACRHDLYGVPYSTLGNPVSGNSLWMSGYNHIFANRNQTKAYLRSWRPELIDRPMFDLVTITGGINNQLPLDNWATPGLTIVMSAVANTPVTFMSVGTDNSGDPIVWFIDQANYLLGLEDPPKVLVGDYPTPEFRIDPELARAACNSYAQLAARGVTLLFSVASYDGVGRPNEENSTCPEFYVSFPASCPYVTAVGGSSTFYGPSEEPEYNGGGFSNLFPRPVYQSVAVQSYLEALEEGLYEGLYNPSGRGVPDVTLHGWWSERLDDVFYWGSNGFSTQFLGAIVTLVNEELILAGKPTLGFLNPFIYQNLDAFRDFTIGNNPGCDTEGFSATTGWDPVSGVGAPLYAKLREAVGL